MPRLLSRAGAMLAVCIAIAFFCALGLRLMATGSSSAGSAVAGAARDVLSFSSGLLHGTLGNVIRTTGRQRQFVPVASLAFDAYRNSMGLLAVAFCIAAFAGPTAGVIAARTDGSALSLGVMALTLLGVSLPSFFAALALQVAEITFYSRTGVRLVPVGGFGWDAHLVLPALVLAARPVAQLARITHSSLTEVAGQDYVLTARAKGLPRSQVWSDHIVPNALVPILTAAGISLRFSLGSLPVVEYFFGWPGMGATLLSAVRARQTNLVIALALALGLTFMCINLLLETVYRRIDPRLRSSAAQQ